MAVPAVGPKPARPHTVEDFNRMFAPQPARTRRPSDPAVPQQETPLKRHNSETNLQGRVEPLDVPEFQPLAMFGDQLEDVFDTETYSDPHYEGPLHEFGDGLEDLFNAETRIDPHYDDPSKDDIKWDAVDKLKTKQQRLNPSPKTPPSPAAPTYWNQALGALGGMTRKAQPKLISAAFSDLPKLDLTTHQTCVDRVEEANALRDAWLKLVNHSFISLKTDEEKDLHKGELIKAFKKAVDVRNEGLKAMLHFRLLDTDKEPANMDKIQEKHVKACEQAFKLDDYERKLFLKLKTFYKNGLKPTDIDAGLKPKDDKSSAPKYPYTKAFAYYALTHFIVTGRLPWTALIPTSWTQAGLITAGLSAIAYDGYNNPKLPDKDDFTAIGWDFLHSALPVLGMTAAAGLVPSCVTSFYPDANCPKTEIPAATAEHIVDAALALKLFSLAIDTKNNLSQPFKDNLKLAATATVNFSREYLKTWKFAPISGAGLSMTAMVANWTANWYWNNNATIDHSSKILIGVIGTFTHLLASGALKFSDDD